MSTLKKFISKWGVAGIKASLKRKKTRKEMRARQVALGKNWARDEGLSSGAFGRKYLGGGSRKIRDYLQGRFDAADPLRRRSVHYVPKVGSVADGGKSQLKVVAFYLPQFHPIPENDEWWGKGFTEWTNVAKAQPQFLGHHQPHQPGELGFYDLRLPGSLRAQVDLAKNYGISGFCFHYYWFGGKRLLETPIDNFLIDKSLDLNFCYCWANENWTRRWDGLEQDVLMRQNHSPEDDIAFIDAMKASFDDSRYIRIDDKPLLIVYRVSELPDPAATVSRWRQRVLELGFSGVYLVAAKSYDIGDPRQYGFDAAVEFPPHQTNALDVTASVDVVNPDYSGKIFNYPELAESFGRKRESEYRLFKTVMPSWDNEARKPGRGHTFFGSTPAAYGKWLKSAAEVTLSYPQGEQILFINAWNEWGEGAHLEPDQHLGYAYLHATGSEIGRHTDSDAAKKLIADFNSEFRKSSDSAVLLHLYYEDLWEEIVADLISDISGEADLFVSLRPDVSLDTIINIKRVFGNVYFFLVENRGRDVRPFLVSMRVVHDMGYVYGCKIHSKKSPQFTDGDQKRQGLIRSLIGGRDVFRRNRDIFVSDPSVSIVAPRGSLINCADPMIHAGNRVWLNKILPLIGRRDLVDNFKFTFPAGTMFWFRVESLSPLLNQDIFSLDLFEEELGQLDRTFAHAIERLIGVLALAKGQKIVELGR